jgi:hypothetical protein
MVERCSPTLPPSMVAGRFSIEVSNTYAASPMREGRVIRTGWITVKPRTLFKSSLCSIGVWSRTNLLHLTRRQQGQTGGVVLACSLLGGETFGAGATVLSGGVVVVVVVIFLLDRRLKVAHAGAMAAGKEKVGQVLEPVLLLGGQGGPGEELRQYVVGLWHQRCCTGG